MAKITIDNITSGYASTTQLNANFDAIESELNNNVLYRNNPAGEPNTMQNDLDMNTNDISNVGDLSMTGNFTVGGVDYLSSMTTVYNNFLSVAQNVTVSASSPSGGNDGDIWFKLI
jgi:hypothetical protein